MLIAVMVIMAAALFWHGTQRDDKKARRAAFVAAALAVLIWLISFLVTTPRETLMQQSSEVVHATSPFSQAKLDELLDMNAGVIGADGALWLQGRDVISMTLERAIEQYRVENNFVSVRGVEVNGQRGRSHLVVRSMLGGEYGGRPVRTEWLLVWAGNDKGEWRVQSIQWLELNGQEPPRGIVW